MRESACDVADLELDGVASSAEAEDEARGDVLRDEAEQRRRRDLATLDDPELMAPQALIWTDSAPSWAALDPRLPHHPKGPK